MTGNVDVDYPLDPRVATMPSVQVIEHMQRCGKLSLDRLRWVEDRKLAQLMYEMHPRYRELLRESQRVNEETERRYP